MLMAVDVSSLVMVLSKYRKENGELVGDGERGLVTRDLLGGCNAMENKKLDLDLEVPMGWEKRLDLASGEVFFQQSSTITISSSSSSSRHPPPPPHDSNPMQDLNFPPLSTYPPPNLGLEFFPPPPSGYQSVCTLDKVKSALHRLEAGGLATAHKPKTPIRGSPSPGSSSTTISSGESRLSAAVEGESRGGAGEDMVTAGCPTCLSYVLVPERNQRCPRCITAVEVAVGKKRRRVVGLDLDLNLACSATGGGGENLH